MAAARDDAPAAQGGRRRGEAMMKVLTVSALICCACASGAAAQSRCRVMDPTGTPLNIRTAPNGAIVGAAPNGLLVSVRDTAPDQGGKPWAFIARFDDGAPLGWVFREFIACF
jgi:hypothetical protein